MDAFLHLGQHHLPFLAFHHLRSEGKPGSAALIFWDFLPMENCPYFLFLCKWKSLIYYSFLWLLMRGPTPTSLTWQVYCIFLIFNMEFGTWGSPLESCLCLAFCLVHTYVQTTGWTDRLRRIRHSSSCWHVLKNNWTTNWVTDMN